jgi:hypothetical protein
LFGSVGRRLLSCLLALVNHGLNFSEFRFAGVFYDAVRFVGVATGEANGARQE